MIPVASTKLSRTPKSVINTGHSKLTRMKHRLKYKVTVTEGEHMEPPQEHVDPLEMEPSAQEHVDPLEMEPSAHEDVPLADDDLGDVQGPSKKNKNQTNLFNRSPPMKIVRVCKAMTDEHRIVIRNTDFGGMLGMKIHIDVIIQTTSAKYTKNWFKACMPYLMVLYVDSLDTDALNVPEDGTQICIWTNKIVRFIIDLDTNSDGSFGKLPLKQCYRIRLSLFSAEPSDIDMFIKCHVVGDHSDEDLVQYRTSVIEMCNVFEDGLAKFLSLSNKENKGLIPEQKENYREQ